MRQNEVQAAQKQLDSLNSQIDKKTMRLLAEQKDKLDAVYAEAAARMAVADQKIAGLTDDQTALTNGIADLEKIKKALEDDVARLLDDKDNSTNDLKQLKKYVTELERHLDQLNASRTALQTVIAELTEQKPVLEAEIADLSNRKAAIIGENVVLEQDFKEKKAQKESDIATLDAKILARAQDIEERKREEMAVRSDLASWQKRLEDRDKILRLREAKVSVGEDKLLHNSTLLNL